MFKKVVRSYAAGEIIFEQGSEVDGIYSVQTGKVSVYRTQPAPEGAIDIELVQLGPGSMFGEMGMLDQTKRDASVKAIDFTEVIIITKDMFENQMTQFPPWVINFIKILVSRLRGTNDKLASAIQTLEANGLRLEDKEGGGKPAGAKPPEGKAAGAKPAGPTESAAGKPAAGKPDEPVKPADPAKPAASGKPAA